MNINVEVEIKALRVIAQDKDFKSNAIHSVLYYITHGKKRD